MKQKFLALLIFSVLLGAFSYYFLNFTFQQSIVFSIFSLSIIGTLFFWEFRIGFVFLGSGIMLLIHSVNLEDFVKYASLDVIWFLIGMMIILAMLKEAGVFYSLTTKVLCIKDISGTKIFIILNLMSWLFSALMGEVTSMLLVASVIFNICEFLEISPVPLLISCVLTTNIGSATTVLGNPIGVLIAARSKLSFEDFVTHSLPITLICLGITIIFLMLAYKNYIKEMSKKLSSHVNNELFVCLINTPMSKREKSSIIIFLITVVLIALHKRVEQLLLLEENTVLIILPIIIAGVVLILNHKKAIKYVHHEVEWDSILFFLFLFAQAGVLQSSGIASKIAEKILSFSKENLNILNFGVVFSSGMLSSILDNTVVVASFIPIIFNIQKTISKSSSLWWALLFGACFGGNITMIGSTANIVALGLLEKKYNLKINFLEWFKVGLVVGIITMFISFLFCLIY